MPLHPVCLCLGRFLRHSVTCISSGKVFNIAGLRIANIVCADADRRARIDRAVKNNRLRCEIYVPVTLRHAVWVEYKGWRSWRRVVVFGFLQVYNLILFTYCRQICFEHVACFYPQAARVVVGVADEIIRLCHLLIYQQSYLVIRVE